MSDSVPQRTVATPLACLQAAAAARVEGKTGINDAIFRGDVADVHDYLTADPSCAEQRDKMPFPPLIWNSKESPAHAKIEICKLLLLANADVNAKDEMNDETVLHYSAGIGNIEECKLLLIAKADVNARSDRLSTPLHCAVGSHNCLEVCKLLIFAKADLAATDRDGETPLKRCRSSPGNRDELLSFLRSIGAPE